MNPIRMSPANSKFLLSALFVVFFGAASLLAQSPLPDHPTPVTTNEIRGTIKSRDLGDSRLTTHYYWFDGAQGDVFINLNSKNFAGDVDVFIQNGLRSLTKIVVYPDFGEVETGRVIYLRKPERLLLRVQGRTPNDETASYRIKFAGSFVAASTTEKDVPEMPTVGESVAGAVRVNSVGTILPPIVKPPERKTEPETPAASPADVGKTDVEQSETEKKNEETVAESEVKKETPKLEVVVDDPIKKEEPKAATTAKRPPRKTRTTGKVTPKKVETPSEKAAVATNAEAAPEKAIPSADKTPNEAKADPLANVQLVIVFKDGRKIERPLPEVFRFSVDRGVLTVVSKDGRVRKYQMVDVAKVTIE